MLSQAEKDSIANVRHTLDQEAKYLGSANGIGRMMAGSSELYGGIVAALEKKDDDDTDA